MVHLGGAPGAPLGRVLATQTGHSCDHNYCTNVSTGELSLTNAAKHSGYYCINNSKWLTIDRCFAGPTYFLVASAHCLAHGIEAQQGFPDTVSGTRPRGGTVYVLSTVAAAAW
eukprot:GHRQ01032787.1.p2 GENE.GHRQ01032787.1~~GHRQ01032787.1.p2  ORF type:complete len:113 (+),score=13.11 GHRQ01032787.1:354-692(+)